MLGSNNKIATGGFMDNDMMQENNGIQFDAPKYESSYIKVIGVGGGGTNAVNHMYTHGIQGVDFIVCNTDDKSLDSSPVPTKIKLGKNGLGAGNIPTVAREKALEISDQIKEHLSRNTQMLFITAGMGGGTGTGAAPVIAKLAKEIEIDDDVNKILVVAIVTLPFSFEGRKRRLQAEEGIAELRKYVDAILIINNDKLRDYGDMKMTGVFAKADDILLTGAKGIAEIITVKSYINIDFRDVNSVMQQSGVALMGSGIAEGEDRALKAIQMATNSALLNDNDIKGAKNILLYLSSSSEHEFTMDEIVEVTDYIHNETGSESDVIWGAGLDDSLGKNLSITLVATGFEAKKIEIPPVIRHEQTFAGIGIKQPESGTTGSTSGTIHVLEEDKVTSNDVKTPENKTPEEDNSIKGIEIVSQSNNTVTAEDSEEATTKDTIVDKEFTIKKVETYETKLKEIKPVQTENTPVSEEWVASRAQRIIEVTKQMSTPEGLENLEKIPAYIARGVKVFEADHSSVSEVSKFTLDENSVLKKENPYLYENPD